MTRAPWLACALFALPAAAQSRAPAEAFLPADHWGYAALRRAAALGVIDAAAAFSAWPVRRSTLRQALDSAASLTNPFARHAENLSLEYPYAGGAGATYDVRAGGGWIAEQGALLGGAAVRAPAGTWLYPGPVAGPAIDAAFARVAADAAWRSLTVGLAAAPEVGAPAGTALEQAWMAVAAGPIEARAGRFGFARSGARDGFVLSSLDRFDGLGVGTARPFRMPGFLSFLGHASGAVHVARFERSGAVRHPWFSAAALSLAPRPGLHIGLQRAVLFGGAGNVQAVTARNVLFMLAGLTSQLGKDSGFENQVASLDAWARTSVAGVPVAFYGELASDDVGFSLLRTAATTAGFEVPRVPGVAPLSMALEYTRIPGSCCGHPPWYRHGDLGEGWTDRGRLLGHPLGGHGTQWSLDWTLALPRAQLGGRAFRRWRGSENLLAPEHEGASVGGRVESRVWPGRALELRVRASTEHGATGWNTWSAQLSATVRLARARRASRVAERPAPETRP